MWNRIGSIVIVALFAVGLTGCGSNRDSDGAAVSEGTTLADAKPVGIDNCLTCHLTGVGQTWIAGVHGNPDDMPNSGLTDPVCLGCHDQLGDGQKVAMATGGQIATDRPVVSCESCHGGGQFHWGVGEIPFPSPDSDRCGQCHNADFPHANFPEGKGIVEAYQSSPHSRSIQKESIFVPGTNTVTALCSKCHTDEGARLYSDVHGDHAALTAALPDTLPALSDPSAIECRTCHQPHQEDTLLEAATAGRSADFNTCTNCHQLLEATSNAKISAFHDPAVDTVNGDTAAIITDTHFATPGNWLGSAGGQNQNDITGYAMDFSSDRACRDCHNPHNADTAINRQWTASLHADKAAAGAWAHYNWTEATGNLRNDGSATGDRTPCQRCHTTTGVIAYLTANADGDPSDYTPPLAYDRNWKPEMLKCNGCHTDNVGDLRSTAAITAEYQDSSGNPVVFPDVDGSNICIACHSGRQNGQFIKDNFATLQAKNFGSANSHYLSAAGTLYKATGYEFAGQDYSNSSDFEHDLIGVGDHEETGTRGPCVTCHLSDDSSGTPNHRFSPFVLDENGDPIDDTPVELCATCHNGDELPVWTQELFSAKADGFDSAITTLTKALENKGIFYNSAAYPYFYADAASSTAFTGWPDEQTLGAAFNLNLLNREPGAFVHNSDYAKRLISDSIDFLDNGAVDGTTGTAIDDLVTAVGLDANEAELAKAYLDGDSASAGVQRP